MSNPGKQPAVSTETFLMEVIACLERNGKMNWDEIAERTGYSKGGASNKYSAIKKAFNAAKDGGTPATPADTSANTPNSAKKRKAEDDNAEEAKTPKSTKLSKTPKTPKTPRSGKKQGKAKQDDTEEDPTVTVEAVED